MLNVKKKPEDFFVRELMNIEALDKGTYCYFILKKRNYNTLDALELISKKIGIGLKRFGFAGNKDKRAVTEQYVSVDLGRGVSLGKLKSINLKNIWIKVVGYGNKRIKLGDNKGNFFRIKFKPKNKFDFCANYFGEQRFGVGPKKFKEFLGHSKSNDFERLNNVEKGRRIVKRDFWDVNSMMRDRNLRMYFHAYQSFLWNKILKKFLEKFEGFSVDEYYFLAVGSWQLADDEKRKMKNLKIPLINFDTELSGEIGKLYKEILDEEEVKKEDFLIRQFPKLISDTVYRNAFAEVKDFKISKGYVEFSLPSGSYATVFLRKLGYTNCKQ